MQQLLKPWSSSTAWPEQDLKITVGRGLELERSPSPQAGNSLPNIGKLATKLEACRIVTEGD